MASVKDRPKASKSLLTSLASGAEETSLLLVVDRDGVSEAAPLRNALIGAHLARGVHVVRVAVERAPPQGRRHTGRAGGGVSDVDAFSDPLGWLESEGAAGSGADGQGTGPVPWTAELWARVASAASSASKRQGADVVVAFDGISQLRSAMELAEVCRGLKRVLAGTSTLPVRYFASLLHGVLPRGVTAPCCTRDPNAGARPVFVPVSALCPPHLAQLWR